MLFREDLKDINYQLLKKCIHNKNICVTGAGGSIGSELCKQIIKYKPSKLILIDNSEFNLYKINQQLFEIYNGNLICYLNDVKDSSYLKDLFQKKKLITFSMPLHINMCP